MARPLLTAALTGTRRHRWGGVLTDFCRARGYLEATGSVQSPRPRSRAAGHRRGWRGGTEELLFPGSLTQMWRNQGLGTEELVVLGPVVVRTGLAGHSPRIRANQLSERKSVSRALER